MSCPDDDGLSRRDFLKTASAGTALTLAAGWPGQSQACPGGAPGASLRSVPAAPAAKQTDPLPRRTLGRTGAEVPILGLGTAPAGYRPRDEAVAFYNDAIDLGVTYLDTAPEFAGYGLAQAALGEVLRQRRDEVFLVTKCFEPNGDAALRLLESNLRELQTDHADLVYAHSIGADQMDPDVVMGKSGVMHALQRAREQGMTRFIGISGHNRPARFLDVIRRFEIDVMMNAVSYVARHIYNFEETVWPEAHERGVGLVAMKVFGGIRGSTDNTQGARAPAEDLHAAYRYAHSLPNISVVVVGAHNRDELVQLIDWTRNLEPLTEAEQHALLARGEQLAPEWGELYGPVA